MERLAEVHWLDIVASAGWESIKDVNPAVMETTGYIVYRDKEVIKIANTKKYAPFRGRINPGG